MRNRKPQTLNEELNKMRKLMGFDINQNSHDVLSESNIIKSLIGEQADYEPGMKTDRQISMEVPYWGGKRKGELNFMGVYTGVPMFAKLKNRKLVSDLGRGETLFITSKSTAPRLVKKDVPDVPDVPDVEVVNIEIKMDLQDPFIFDTTNLTKDAVVNFKDFIETYNSVKNENEGVWSEYLNFLKENAPIEISGWASIDDDPEELMFGGFSKCNLSKKQLRKDYNKCLSQKRAEKILSLIEEQLPELEGLFKPVGHGETDQFNGVRWTKDKDPSTDETAPNRRFSFALPKFEKGSVDPEPPTPPTPPTPTPDPNDDSTFDSILDMSEYFGVEAKIPAKSLYGGESVALDVNYLNELYDRVGDVAFKKALPKRGDGDFNMERTGNGKIVSDGFLITTSDVTIKFNKWYKTSEKTKNENVSYRLLTESRPCIVGKGDGYSICSLIAIGIAYYESHHKGVNVQT
jgi:hypothetical protein